MINKVGQFLTSLPLQDLGHSEVGVAASRGRAPFPYLLRKQDIGFALQSAVIRNETPISLTLSGWNV